MKDLINIDPEPRYAVYQSNHNAFIRSSRSLLEVFSCVLAVLDP